MWSTYYGGSDNDAAYSVQLNSNNDIYTIEKFSITRKRILSLAEKTNGNILCGTENDGLFEINYKTKKAFESLLKRKEAP